MILGMRSARRARWAGAGLALLAGCGGAGRPGGDAAAAPLSLLVVTIDTLRADAVGCYGATPSRTPHLDRLAAAGTRFAQAQAPAPLTLPSHAALFTGRGPWTTGVHVNGDDPLPASGPPTLAELLRARGYRTLAVVGSFALASAFGLDRGFEVYDDDFPTGPMLLAEGALEPERRAADVAAIAERLVAGLDERPFFLWVHFFDPHAPYDPPPEHAGGNAARDRYLGEVAAADAGLGRVLAALDRRGRSARTLVIVAADHGEALGEHGERGHGVFLYQTTLRVPLVLRLPGVVAEAVSDAPVSLLDVLPTALDLLGLPAPEGLEGRSLRDGGSGADRRLLLAESRYGERAFGWAPLVSIRDGRSKLIDAPRPELFDLGADPGEERNLAAARPDEIAGLRLRARAALSAAPASAPPAGALDPEAGERLAALGYLSGATSQASGRDPKDGAATIAAMTGGLEAAARGEWEQARARFAEVVAAEPANPAARFQLGRAALALGDLAAARRELEEAVRLDPRLGSAWESLGAALERAGDREAAVAAWREGAGRVPAAAALRLRLGAALLALGRPLEARPELERAAALAPGKADAWLFLAEGRAAAGEPAAAGEACRRALAILPDAPRVRGRCEELEAASSARR